MPEKKKEAKEVFLHFYYIGSDQSYWTKFQARSKKIYHDKEIAFSSFDTSIAYSPSTLFHTLLHSSANIVLIDFSTKLEEALLLAKLLRNDNRTKMFSTIGLFDFLAETYNISRALLMGVRINHFKGDELSSVIYQSVAFFDPNKIVEVKYALAKVSVEQTLRIDLRMVYSEKNVIRIETSSPLIQGEEITLLKTSDNRPTLRIQFKLTEVKDSNLYYNSRFYALLTPVKPEAIKELLSDKASSIVTQKAPKALKICVFDRDLNILADEKFSYKKLPYSFNFQSQIHPEHIIIKRLRPLLITIQLSDDTITIASIYEMMNTIKNLENYNPFLVLFNYKESESVTKVLNYPKVIAHSEPFSWPVIEQMSATLASKIPPPTDGRFFFSSSNHNTIVKVEKDITVIGFDEQNIYFECKDEIPMYTVVSMIYPINMLVTIIPLPSGSEFNSTPNTFKGLINLISEDRMQQLRLKINEIFFLEKKKQQAEEQRINKELALKYQNDKEQIQQDKIKEAEEKKDKKKK